MKQQPYQQPKLKTVWHCLAWWTHLFCSDIGQLHRFSSTRTTTDKLYQRLFIIYRPKIARHTHWQCGTKHKCSLTQKKNSCCSKQFPWISAKMMTAMTVYHQHTMTSTQIYTHLYIFTNGHLMQFAEYLWPASFHPVRAASKLVKLPLKSLQLV